jgi:hypothetical protein
LITVLVVAAAAAAVAAVAAEREGKGYVFRYIWKNGVEI